MLNIFTVLLFHFLLHVSLCNKIDDYSILGIIEGVMQALSSTAVQTVRKKGIS